MIKKRLLLLLCLLLAASLLACDPKSDPTGTTSTPTEHIHYDKDDNGQCDTCGESVLVEIDFFAINDLHGKYLDSPTQPGVDELTSFFHNHTGNTLLLSTGDMWQGSAESNLTHGNLITEWMNQVGFVSMTLGNHEFDWGESYIQANEALADFPFLAINIFERATGEPVSYCQPSVMVERAGVKVGIIGAIGNCYSSISSDKTEDIFFKTGPELTQLVKDESESLRRQGADIIVYSIHDGFERNMSSETVIPNGSLSSYYDASLSDGYVDLVFEAHIHKRYVFTDQHGVYHLQGGGENDGISHAQVTYNTANDSITQVDAQFVSNGVYDDYASHPSVNTLLNKYQDALAPGNEVIGTNGQYRKSDELRNLVAQLYYEVGMERWGAEYDLVLGGGFISIRNPWNLESGDVTYGQLQTLFPFDNQLVLCSVSGDSLRRNFLESDNDNYFIYLEDYGHQVWDTLDPNGTYYIITDTYCSNYRPNQLTVVAEYDPGVYARDLLADYIRAGGMENEPIPDQYRLTDIPTLMQICQSLAPGQVSQEYYYVKGTVVSIASTKYGNMTIEDENGNQIYIYGTYDQTGMIRYDGMDAPPQIGDTVILMGTLQNYVPPAGAPVYEMVRARLLEVK